MAVLPFPPSKSAETPALALQLAMSDNLQEVIVAGYDHGGYFVVRSSGMDRKEALWIAEQIKLHILEIQ